MICSTGKIINISPTLWQFSQLRILHLRNNNLTAIPGDVMRLTNLVVLDASSNKLHTLPPELGELFNLKDLVLSHNCLRHLPYELGKLFQLQKLGKSVPHQYMMLSTFEMNLVFSPRTCAEFTLPIRCYAITCSSTFVANFYYWIGQFQGIHFFLTCYVLL